MKQRKTIIQDKVFKHVEEIYEYIKENSPQNAEKFKQEVKNKIQEVESHPTAYPPENIANSKKQIYRFTLVMKSWKLVFKVTQELLIFLGIIHTSRHPNEIKKLKTNKYDKKD
jgi:plasmid stabilization system protein ParE